MRKWSKLYDRALAGLLWTTGGYMLVCLARIVLHYMEHGVS